MMRSMLMLASMAGIALATQVTIIVENVPGNFNGVKVTGSHSSLSTWNPCNGRSARRSGGNWKVTVNLPQGRHKLKAIGYPSGNSCNGATWEPNGNTVVNVVGSQAFDIYNKWGESRTHTGGAGGGSSPPPTGGNPGSTSSKDVVNGAHYFVYNRRPEGMRHVIRTKYYDGYDVAGVERSGDGKYCWIAFKETDEGGDDANNARIGNIDVLNTGKPGRALRGMNGFAGPYNGMRQDLWNTIDYECRKTPGIKYVFTGFSRGGGIAAIAAAAYYKEGRVGRNIALATFGAVRALTRGDANSVHGRFEQWRIVYRRDGVPSAIPSFLGFSHYGWNVLFDSAGAGYRAGQNAPSGRWDNYGDHDCCYRSKFPVQYWDSTPSHKNW